MSNWLSLPILGLAVLIQSTFMPQIRILGGTPHLVFLLVLAWSVHARLEVGVTWAFVGGILQDLMSVAPTGATVLGLVVVVFMINQVKSQIYGLSIIVLLGLLLAGTVIQQLLFFIVLIVSGFSINLFDSLTYIVLPTIPYNLVFFLPVYWFVRQVQRRFTREERLFTV